MGKLAPIVSLATGQMVAFLLSVVITRSYSPSDVGGFVLFSTCFSVLSVLIMARYEQAIIFADSIKDVPDIVLLCCIVSGLVGVVLLIARLSTPLNILNSVSIEFVVILLIASFLAAASRTVTFLWTRLDDIIRMSAMNFVRPASVPFMQIVCSQIHIGSFGLIYGQLYAYIAVALVPIFLDRKIRAIFFGGRVGNVIKLAKYYSSFPKYSLPQNLIYLITEASIPLFVAAQFGSDDAGLFWFAAKVSMAPFQVIVESVRPIYYREIVKSIELRQDFFAMVKPSIVRLGLPVLLIFTLLTAVGEQGFDLVFGSSWALAGHISAVLMFGAIFNAVSVPFIAILSTLHSQRTHMYCELLASLAKIVLIYSFSSFGITVALAAGVAGACICYSVLFILTKSKYREYLLQSNDNENGS